MVQARREMHATLVDDLDHLALENDDAIIHQLLDNDDGIIDFEVEVGSPGCNRLGDLLLSSDREGDGAKDVAVNQVDNSVEIVIESQSSDIEIYQDGVTARQASRTVTYAGMHWRARLWVCDRNTCREPYHRDVDKEEEEEAFGRIDDNALDYEGPQAGDEGNRGDDTNSIN
ncbi:hypothetical protein PInf_003198 [Phytophthora infestans]|nr:hypothetical protein PInf_003198 [Phytophthora infestans]